MYLSHHYIASVGLLDTSVYAELHQSGGGGVESSEVSPSNPFRQQQIIDNSLLDVALAKTYRPSHVVKDQVSTDHYIS